MMEYWRNEQNQNANSGSELMMQRLEDEFRDDPVFEKFHFTLSRLRGELPKDKIRIYWAHDLHVDPESEKALANEGWKRFNKIVFVSYWQQSLFNERFQIPYSKTVVLRNSIHDIPVNIEQKFEDSKQVKFIYHTTPHRGLAILVSVFEKLYEEYGDKIHLDVFSSFKLYGWEEQDKKFQPLYDRIHECPGMTYYGSVSNDEIRSEIKNAHVFAYPSVWLETSCLSLIEAMNAGCVCVHPGLGALPETAGGWTVMYPHTEDNSQHAGAIYARCKDVIDLLLENSSKMVNKLMAQKAYSDMAYSWDIRKHEWEILFNVLKDDEIITDEPSAIDNKQGLEVFSYNVDV